MKQLENKIRPALGRLGRRWRLAARIRLANALAAKHPKRACALVVGTLLMIIVGDILLDGHRQPEASAIASVEPMFCGFRAIQANKEAHRKAVLELAAEGRRLRCELDSLIAIPSKSHDDSVGIVRRYGQLERIVESIKQNNND